MAKSLFPDARPKRRRRLFSASADWLAQQTADVAVLSAEHFAFVEPKKLKFATKRFLPDYLEDMRVVAYARPHMGRLVSSFSQSVKIRGYQGTFEDYCRGAVKSGRFHYAPRFTKWRDTFGSAFTLRPLIGTLIHRQDVVADFLHTVLDTDNFELTADSRQNESPTVAHLACLKFTQAALMQANIPSPARKALCASLSKRLIQNADSTGQQLKMPSSGLSLMQDAYRADAAALDTSFFQGTPFSDALEKAGHQTTDEPQSFEISDHFNPARCEAFGGIIGEIVLELKADPGIWQRHYRDSKSEKDDSDEEDITFVTRIVTLLDDVCAVLK